MIEQKMFAFKEEFEKKLSNYFDSLIAEAALKKDLSESMLKILKEFTLRGGKRIRPALVYYGYLCFTDEKREEAMNAGIAAELVQTFLLIHDDIMDKDDFRRSKPTIHKIYQKYFDDDAHMGTSLAIIAGDLSITLANEALLSINIPAERKIKAGIILNKVLNRVGFGQELDVVLAKQKCATEEEILRMHNLKTAKYTFEGPLLVGAALAGASKRDIGILEAYSTSMGLAFQLQDDILGLFGDEKKLGKPIGSDIRQGKKTLLVIKAEQNCEKKDKSFLQSVLKKSSITKDDIRKVREVVVSSGSLKYSQDMISELLKDAKSQIKNSGLRKEGKDFLLALANLMESRDY